MAGLLLLIVGVAFVALYVARRKKQHESFEKDGQITFFHPFCNAGGGGERVLWSAIHCFQDKNPNLLLTVYIEDTNYSGKEIVEMASKKFNLGLNHSTIRFVKLRLTWLLKASTFPRLTLLGQIIGSVIVGFEGVLRHRPKSILFDTMGNAFVYPAFSLVSGAKIVAYTHYPFISEEMVKRVVERRTSYNNAKGITNSILGSSLKVAYYNLLKWTYSVVGRLAWRAMANSTWTFNHLRKVWPSTQIDLVYPPCDVEPFLVRESTNTRTRTIVSLAQFRPEKNHRLQLESFGLIAKRFPDLRLILIGGCRDASDEQRVKELTQLAVEMGISGQVTFKVNVSFSQIVKHLQTSLIGLHTMIDEHFGISIVEFMAAGLVTVAHRSGGPKSDIIDEQANGFLAESPAEYANIIEQILLMPNQELEKIRNAAKGKATSHFSLEKFAAALNDIYVQ